MGVRAPAVPSYGENFPVFKAQIEKKKKKRGEANEDKIKKKEKTCVQWYRKEKDSELKPKPGMLPALFSFFFFFFFLLKDEKRASRSTQA